MPPMDPGLMNLGELPVEKCLPMALSGVTAAKRFIAQSRRPAGQHAHHQLGIDRRASLLHFALMLTAETGV
jgi:hypothetical protein